MTDNIELTHQELEDAKDEVKFRVSTTIYLKQNKKDHDDLRAKFERHCTTSQTFRDRVAKLATHVNIQWVLIAIFLSGVITKAAKLW